MSTIPLAVNTTPLNYGTSVGEAGPSLQALINQTKLQEQAIQQGPSDLIIKQQQAQQQQIATQEAQQNQKDQLIFSQAFKDSGGDWEKAIQGAIKAGASGTFAAKALPAYNDYISKKALLTKDQLANESEKSNQVAESALRVINAEPADQESTYAEERNKHLASGAFSPQEIPEQMPPITDLEGIAHNNKFTQDIITKAQAIQDEEAAQPTKAAENAVKQQQSLGELLGNAQNDVIWQSILKNAKMQKIPDSVISNFADHYSPEEAARAKTLALTPEQQQGATGPAADQKYRNIVMNQQLGRPVSPEDAAYAKAYEKQKELNTVTRINMENGASSGGGNAKDIADAIVNGDQPPVLTGLYRMAGPVRAELARQGFPLAKATEDWNATQKYLSTLNGAQQVRLRQAVNFTSDSLPLIKDLYDQWQKTGLPTGFKDYNKAALIAASHLPGKTGSIATNLISQIADLTSELGTVYKGGNSSTDETLKLAATNLSGDWNQQTFSDAYDRINKNLKIRKNSISTGQAAGVGQDNQYTPSSEKPQQFAVPSGAPTAPKEDGHKLKQGGNVIAISKGGQWVAPSQ